MPTKSDLIFLGRRMRELREKNNCTQEEMASKLQKGNKSSISRLESGEASYKTMLIGAEDYCRAFQMTKSQTEQFLRGGKIAVPDTSALLKKPQLIDELNKEYSKVVIAKIVVDELNTIKNRRSGAVSRKAWEVISDISYGDKVDVMEYRRSDVNENNDCKIISIARDAVERYGCKADIITEDVDYSAYLKNDENISALYLRAYMKAKQPLINMTRLIELNAYYAESYDHLEALEPDEVNAYLPDGNTLLISAIRNREAALTQRKNKIRWLIAQGADVNQRDCNRRYFLPLSHAIQINDYEIFCYLLSVCHADPNIGSKNPQSAGNLKQKNEGNMPLMIAAWEGKSRFVEALCKDQRTSINQQDANGFTALIKACANGHDRCRDILLQAGADQKILDYNGKTAKDHEKNCAAFGPLWDHFHRDGRKPDKWRSK